MPTTLCLYCSRLTHYTHTSFAFLSLFPFLAGSAPTLQFYVTLVLTYGSVSRWVCGRGHSWLPAHQGLRHADENGGGGDGDQAAAKPGFSSEGNPYQKPKTQRIWPTIFLKMGGIIPCTLKNGPPSPLWRSPCCSWAAVYLEKKLGYLNSKII